MKKRFVFLAVIIGVLICVSGLVIHRKTLDNNELKVAVITKSTSSSFWADFLDGVAAGAQEYNVIYEADGPENEEDAKSQNKMIKEAIDKQVGAIIISAVSADKSNDLIEEAQQKGIGIIVVDSGVTTNYTNMFIGTDNISAGAQMADAVSSMKVDNINVGIINFDVNSANGQEREKGFRTGVENDNRIKIVDCVNVESNTTAAKKAALKMMALHPEINVIVTMNEWTTLGVGYAIEENNCAGSIQVYGFDSNKFCIDMLEAGGIDGLIVQNPYAMGYTSIQSAYNLCENKRMDGNTIYTDTTLVTRENLYEEGIQKILFPVK